MEASQFAFLGNNPLNLVDPEGKEPNKSQATTPQKLILMITAIPGATARDKLNVLGTYSTLGGPDPSHKRYIYSEEGGWIDLVHFFAVVKGLDQLSGVKRKAALVCGSVPLWQKTKEIEDEQAAKGSIGTAWSYEDAPSNYLGFEFWRWYYAPKGKLEVQMSKFLNDFRATKPENAPNWKQMWTKEKSYKQQFPQNKSFSPIFTKPRCPDIG